MYINGREVNFLRTMGANAEIADLAPDGDISKLGMVMEGTTGDSIRVTAKFVCALHKGYVDNHKYVDPSYNVKTLTPQEVLSLSEKDYIDLVSEAVKAYTNELPTIQTEPAPAVGKKTAGVKQKKSN